MIETSGQTAAQQKGVRIGQAAAFHLATIQHDTVGESTGRILHEVRAFVPDATEPDLMQALGGLAQKRLLKVKPDGFVRVHPQAVNELAKIAKPLA